jgi:hypothetical protein
MMRFVIIFSKNMLDTLWIFSEVIYVTNNINPSPPNRGFFYFL